MEFKEYFTRYGRKAIDKIIKYRFILCLICFIFLVSFKIHGSSIGMWDTIVSEKINVAEQDIILGKNRDIRSDEWAVQTPYFFAQAMNAEFYPLHNKNIMAEEGLNMILAYNSPVFDITVLAKPLNWGFIFLGKEYGLSWYWAFKTLGLLLLAFEISMILTKKNKLLSILGAFWITFSPAVQWWFMQHVGDVVFYTLAIIVAAYKYLEYKDDLKKKIIFAIMFALSSVGFALMATACFQLAWCFISVPEWLAKITLLSYVPNMRMLLMFNFTSMLLSIWAIAVIFREDIVDKKIGLLISVITITIYATLIYLSPYKDYVSKKYFAILFIIYFIVNLSIFCNRKILFYPMMIIIICISGMTVNPIVKGIGAIYNKTLSREVISIVQDDKDALWIAEGEGVKGEFLYANGARVINGTHFYPNYKLWSSLENGNMYDKIYNRYAHVSVLLTDDTTEFILNYPDDFTVKMNINKLKKLNVRYIWTKNELDNQFKNDNIKFELLYYSSSDENRVYKIIYE